MNVGMGVCPPIAAGNTDSPSVTSRIDLLRARVHSRQQKIVESIFKSRERTHDADGDGSSIGEVSEILPLHMQQRYQQPFSLPSPDTRTLKDQLHLIHQDRERLRSELASLQEKHQQREQTLQSEILTFKYKYNVLQKEIELTNEKPFDKSSPKGFFSVTGGRHVRKLSSPPRDDYFTSSSENDPSTANVAMRKLSRRVHAVQQNTRDVISVEKLQQQVGTLEASKKSYQDEVSDLQAEVIRLNLCLDLQADEDDWISNDHSDKVIADYQAHLERLTEELQSERAKQYEGDYGEDGYSQDLETIETSTDIVCCSGCNDDYDYGVSDASALANPSLNTEFFQDMEWCLPCINVEADHGALINEEASKKDVSVSSATVGSCAECEYVKTVSSEMLAQMEEDLEESQRQNDALTAELAALKLVMESTEKRIRLTNETTGRFHELNLSKSHDLSLYDVMYNHEEVRYHRVRTWPMKIAQDVRNKVCEIKCLLLNGDGETLRSFEIEDLKNLTTHQVFDLSAKLSGVVKFVLQCHKTEEMKNGRPTSEDIGTVTIAPIGMRINIANERTQVSKELFLPISEDFTVFEKIYCHIGVKVSVRKWPLEVIWQVNHKRSKIVCDLAGVDTKEVDDLKNMSLKDLHELAPNRNGVIILTLKCEKLEDEGLPSPFEPTGFRQRGWLPSETPSCDLRVRITNETSLRSKDLIVPISDSLTIYDAVYDSKVVRRANVRKWRSLYARAITKELSAISCHQVDENAMTIRSFAISALKEVTTKCLAEHIVKSDTLIRFVLRCETTEKGKARAQRDDLQVRVVNHTTLRFKDLHIPYSEEMSLYEAIYNNVELRAAQVRMWPKEILDAIKAETSTIQCHLLDEQGSDAVQVFSVDKLKDIPTKRIFDLLPNSKALPKFVLKCQVVEKGELSLRVSNEITGRFKDVTVPISQDMTLYDVIYMNASIKFSYVRMWPSETVQAVKNKAGEIYCAMMGRQTEITFSIDDLKKTTTTQLVELSPAPSDLIKLVLRYRETDQLTQEEIVSKEEVNEIRLRLTNGITGRFKDLTVPIATEFSLYQSIYSHRSVKAGRVRVWPSELVHDLKQKAVEVECTLLDSSGGPIYTFTVEGLRNTSTKRLLELSPNHEDVINLILKCEARAHTGSYSSKLREKFKSRGFHQHRWLPAETSPTHLRVRITNELSRRSKDLIVPISEVVTLYESVYKHPEVKRGNIRKWSCTIAKEVRRSLSEIKCVQLDDEGGTMQEFSIDKMREATSKELLRCLPSSQDRVNLVLRYLRTTESASENEDESPDIAAVLSSDSSEGADCSPLEPNEKSESVRPLSFKPTGFRQRGWLPARKPTTDLRVRLTNEKTGRWKDLLVPLSENLTLYDAVYNNKMVIRANVRKYPSAVATTVKEKTCEIYTEMFVPRFGMVKNGSAFATDSMDDILFDDEGNAVRSLSIDDLYQTTTMEIFELLSRPTDRIKVVLKVKKVEAVDALENKLCNVEQKLRDAEEQAKRGAELLSEKLKALDDSTQWNQELANELERLKDEVISAKPSTPQNTVPLEATPQFELLKEKEVALEQARKRNESLELQLDQLQTEIEVLETSTNKSIMPEYNSVLDHVIEEEDEEFSEDLSLKPIGFRQRGWLSDQSSSMDMRLRITNETTHCCKDFVVPISPDVTLFESVFSGAQSSDASEVFDKTSKVQCVVWHDLGKGMRTFSVDELKQLSTKRFFELTSRRQDLLKVLLRCQEKAQTQVRDLESQIANIRQRNGQLQDSMCVLSNELASSVGKHNRLQLELDTIRQGQEGGLLFSSELFEI